MSIRIWWETSASCRRRNNRRNQIHGKELRIPINPDRTHVQCGRVILNVAFDKDRLRCMIEPRKAIN